MSATIIVEDGGGSNPNANSYVSIADADAFFLTSISNAQWDAASADLKTRVLLTATRILENSVEWAGFKANLSQPLQWPRVLARDPNQYGGAYYRRPDTYLAQYFDPTKIHKDLKNAFCEFARFILAGNNAADDRTADAPGKGVSKFEIFEGIKVEFDKKDQRPIVPDVVSFLLSDFGQVRSSKSGNARVSRV